MNMIVDIVLLAVSGAAAFYCAVLHRRLGKLMDVDKGLGVGIASMSAALDETRGVLQFAQESCRRSIDELAPMLERAGADCARLSELTDVASELTDLATEDIDRAADAAIERIAAASVRQNFARSNGALRTRMSPEAASALRARGLEHLLG